MARGPDPITLSEDDRRVVGGWAALCAARALPIFEARAAADSRPREALAGIRAFAQGGPRTARLRALAWAAWAAAREVGDPAAAAAARAASLAAAVAYTHPLATAHQTKHALGPAAYAALARELAEGGDPAAGDGEVRWALEQASPEVVEVVGRMHARAAGRGRLDLLLHGLDVGLRPASRPRAASGTP